MGADWKRTAMLEHFRDKYVQNEEVIVNDFVSKVMNNDMTKKDWILYDGVKFRKTYYYRVIAWLLAQKDENIKCPEKNCDWGFATINAGEEISCNWCGHLFYPYKDMGPEIAVHAQAYIDRSEEHEELRKKKEKIIDKDVKVTYNPSSDGYDIIK